MIGTRTLAVETSLLAYDLQTNPLTRRIWGNSVVRGGALTEFLANGTLVSGGGRVRCGGAEGPNEPRFDAIVAEAGQAGTLTWKQLLQRSRPTFDAVEKMLLRDGLIERSLRGDVAVRDRDLVARIETWTVTG